MQSLSPTFAVNSVTLYFLGLFTIKGKVKVENGVASRQAPKGQQLKTFSTVLR